MSTATAQGVLNQAMPPSWTDNTDPNVAFDTKGRAYQVTLPFNAFWEGGLHPNGRRTHGHTMIVDPWGEVLASQAEGEGVVLAELDTARIAEVRQSLPALGHRKMR